MTEKVLHEFKLIETEDGFRVEVKGDKEKIKKMGFGRMFGMGMGFGGRRGRRGHGRGRWRKHRHGHRHHGCGQGKHKASKEKAAEKTADQEV
ncbi:MAG: hypothetical protein AAF614_30585 [Chloroflexota bacterium]